jgi:hypothetical protein
MEPAEWFRKQANRRLIRRYKEPLGAIHVHSTKPTLFDELVSLLPEKEIKPDDRWEDRWGDGEPPRN